MGLKSLRTEHVDGRSLTDAIQRLGAEFELRSSARFELAVEGQARVIKTVVQEEILLIAREALVNAFTHAGATLIRVHIAYSRREFCISVVDDGRGIDPIYCESSREGHWGLSGMRERALKLRGSIKVRRLEGRGTAIEFRVPAVVAFREANGSWRRIFAPEEIVDG